MPAVVLIIFALFGAAFAAAICFLAGFFGHALWTGQLKHFQAEYFKLVVVFALEAAFAHALLLGTPLFLGLYRLGWLKWWVCMLAGFVIGAVPTAVRAWPLHHAAGNVTISVLRGGKMVQTIVNGVPTLAGWLDYAYGVLTYAGLGAVGGLVFWLLWRSAQPALERMPTRR